MINNSYISLSKSSIIRNDAINSIKHTLLLDYKIPQISNILNPIPDIMNSCHKCCCELFQNVEYFRKANNKIYFGFFGDTQIDFADKSAKKHNVEEFRKNAQELSFLDTYTIPYNQNNSKDNPSSKGKNDSGRQNTGFPAMIMDHCVISCYHAVITDLLGGKSVTLYESVNNIKYNGFYSLYKSNKINFQSEDVLKKNKYNQYENTKKSSASSDFGRKIETHFKYFPYLQTLFENKNDSSQEAARYYLQFSGLLSHFCEIDARNLRLSPSNITENNKLNILEKIENFSAYISTKKVTGIKKPVSSLLRHSNLVDELYYRYIIERIFNLNLFYSLLRNIHRIELHTNYRLCQKEIIDILSLCQKLPNTFSRQYFLQYAFDKIITQPMSYHDFWFEHTLDMNNHVLGSLPKSKFGFQLIRWLEQFELFCNYMAEFIIPIYEWCFTNMVMEVVEQKASIESNQNNPSDFHKLCLIKAMKLLADYIEKNYHQIVCPFLLPKHQDTLDITADHTSGILDLNIPADTLQNLFEAFFPSQKNLDLNLPHLNRDFFIKGKNGYGETNRRHIRNFYLNLLFPN